MIPAPYYLGLSGTVLAIALIGIFLNRRSIILILLCVELMLLAASINFVAFASHTGTITGHAIALFVLAVAAAETAIGLAILVVYYRLRSSIDVDDASHLKG